jgi:biopolymer transport protein ExbD
VNSLHAQTASRRRGLISLTPLIDVVFILLVFFMLASSFLDWRAIDLDAPAQASGASSDEGALLVEVRDADLRLSGKVVTLDALGDQIAEQLRETPERKVLVRPAAGVPLQRAVQVLDRLSAAGAKKISLIRAGAR